MTARSIRPSRPEAAARRDDDRADARPRGRSAPRDYSKPDSLNKDLVPGDRITRYLPGHALESGTLSFLARKKEQNGTSRYIVTNDHVLADHTMNLPGNADIYDPERKACIPSLGIGYN